MISKKLFIGVFMGFVAAFFLHSGHASAATISVTANAVDQTTNGNCSLYEAIDSANTNAAVDNCTAGSGADTINLPNGSYDLSVNAFGPTLNSNISLVGQSVSSTIIDGNGFGLVLDDNGGTPQVNISNITFTNSAKSINANLQNVSLNIDNIRITSGTSGIDVLAGNAYTGSFTLTNSTISGLTSSSSNDYALYVRSFNAVNISNTTIHTNSGEASKISVEGLTTQVDNVNIYDNSGKQLFGIAGSVLTLNRLNMYSNNITDNGGGVFSAFNSNAQDFDFTMTNSAFYENISLGVNLAIGCDTANSCLIHDVSNVTVAQNTSLYPAIFFNERDNQAMSGSIRNITIANNNRTGTVGGDMAAGIAFISNNSVQPTLTLENVLLANNLDETTPRNCVAPVSVFLYAVSAGHNLSSDSSCSGMFNQSSDLNNTNPLLGTLTEDNNTHVIPLLTGSPAINGGATIAGLTTDQRGASRPQGSGYDIGAYEVLGESTPDPGNGGGGNGGGNSNNGANTGSSPTAPKAPNTGLSLASTQAALILMGTGIVLLSLRRKLQGKRYARR